jgi:hypothetical protein
VNRRGRKTYWDATDKSHKESSETYPEDLNLP